MRRLALSAPRERRRLADAAIDFATAVVLYSRIAEAGHGGRGSEGGVPGTVREAWAELEAAALALPREEGAG